VSQLAQGYLESLRAAIDVDKDLGIELPLEDFENNAAALVAALQAYTMQVLLTACEAGSYDIDRMLEGYCEGMKDLLPQKL
jgi:pyruvate formate-lyase activating enzyme-like uncharacterized protein